MASDTKVRVISRLNGSSLRCNGKRISGCRKRLNLTQCELAKRTGYSERLIRKAESCGTVMPVVLKDLAIALSTPDSPVTVAYLTADPEHASRDILAALCGRGRDWMSYVGDLVSEEAQLRCVGDPSRIPFAGVWRGRRGFSEWANIFCSTVSKPTEPMHDPEFLTKENQVVVWNIEIWDSPTSDGSQPIWMTMRMSFEKGELNLMEVLFDTYRGCVAIQH
ncbi:MAG: helix-turn-helix transcriptional regulator [Planctomycetales bacterium]|nr:helix-turn-helix transcriptional regulator [Planctomycetales bacterium]